MNKKENWLRLIKNDNPGWIGLPWEAFKGNGMGGAFVGDPISGAIRGRPVLDVPIKDAWGTYWLMQQGSPSPVPIITDENKALKDITKWKETVVFPALDGYDWTPAKEYVDSIDRNEFMVATMLAGGLFERSHYLMGFEDALCNYIEEPEAMKELLGAIADWKIGHLELIFKYLSPDAVVFHDDWGNKVNLFLPPKVWREIIKPHQKRIVDFVKSHGVLYIHHSDTYLDPLVDDMVEIGVDVWQGAIPQNDIVSIQKRINGKMAIMGGIDAAIIDMPEADEEIIRQEVRRCIDTYCPQGYFIPCIPNIVPIFPEVKRIYEDELLSYGRDFFKRL